MMSSFSLLSVYLSGASLILLLTAAVSQAQYDEFTLAPDYDLDYNATFEYSFFSNASNEDLDKFSERYIDQDGGEEEDTGGRQQEEEEEEEEDIPVTMATTPATTVRGKVNVHGAASLPVCPDLRTLLWTLMIVIGLNTHQLRHTL